MLEEAIDEENENVGNPEEAGELEQQQIVVAESAVEDNVQEVPDEAENPANQSEEIDYRAKYAKSPENFPVSGKLICFIKECNDEKILFLAATSPQPLIKAPEPTGFSFLNSVQEAAGASISLFGFGPSEPNPSSIFNLF